jgi:putative ABC transport system permease protein
MKKARIVKSGFRTMGRHKLRTFFIMIGIVIGITALTLIVSLGKGMEKTIMDNVNKLFSASSIMVNAGGGRMRGGPHSGDTSTNLTIEDFQAIQEEIPNIDTWDPMQLLSAREVIYRDKRVTIRIIGQSPRSEIVWNRSVSRGDFFDDTDMKTTARVALIGETVARELFGDGDPIDRQIRIGNVPCRIKGILERWGTDLHGLDRDNEIVLPITTVMRRLMNVDYISMAKILVKDYQQTPQTVARITEILRERHHIAEGEQDDFVIITPEAVQKMVAQANRVFNLFLPLIALISLIVGGVVAANLMLLSVSERKSEIGLRKAVGARSRDILWQFLMETAAITITGGIIGIILGLVAVHALAGMMGIPGIISWPAIGLALVFSLFVGLAAGVFPARRASALEPVEILR